MTMSGSDEETLRVELAAVFRLAARFGWSESVANHFSAAVSEDGQKFLLNPRWRHFSQVRASELLLLDAKEESTMDEPDAPDLSAWSIHGAVHASLPNVRALLHVHSPYATAVASLQDPTIVPIDQNTARFFGEVAYDLEEGQRLTGLFEEHEILMMGNHGVAVASSTIAGAFESLYYLERACQTLILAYSTGKPLSILSDDMAAKVAKGWKQFDGMGQAHLDQWMEILDKEDPSYRD